MIKHCLRAAALLLLAGAIASCGGAAVSGAKAPYEEDLATPDAALAALDRAEASLGLALGASAPGGYAKPAASGAPMGQPPPPPVAQADEPRAPPSPRPAPPAQPTASRVEREGPRTPSDPCGAACSALASMERATEHLCGLAGAGNKRCQSARERVKSASSRVQAACPACAR